MINGIDVSNWQGAVDFSQVKAQGYEIAYIKATEGEHTLDAFCGSHYQNAKANGMKIGFYHFLQGDEDGVSQANFMYSVIKDYSYDCKIAIDVETTNGASPSQLSQIVCNFATQIKSLTGNDVVIYTYSSFGSNLDNTVSSYPLWIANYGTNEPTLPTQWNNYIGWQYSQSGQVNGCPAGNTDLDYFTNDIYLSVPKTNSLNYRVGENVIVTGSTYATGQAIPMWVKQSVYPITQIDSGKVLIGGGIDSWIEDSGVIPAPSQPSSLPSNSTNNEGFVEQNVEGYTTIYLYNSDEVYLINSTNWSNTIPLIKGTGGWSYTTFSTTLGEKIQYKFHDITNNYWFTANGLPTITTNGNTNNILTISDTIGWKEINGIWYYYSTSGEMQTGWQKINDTWYYLNASGQMQTGLISIGNYKYYLNASGQMQTGTVNVGGVEMFFNSNGQYVPPTPKNTGNFVVGEMVNITGNNYSTGQIIPEWVKGSSYPITQVDTNRVLLGGGLDSWLNNSSVQSTAKVVGDIVRVIGSTYATGQQIPMWVKQGTYPIIQVGNGECLLGGGIDSWVSNNDLVLA